MPAPAAPRVSIAVAVLCAVATAAVLYPSLQSWLLRIQPWTADWRTLALSDGAAAPHASVALVLLNRETLRDYPYKTPTPRDLLAKIVEHVDRQQPAAIGIDFYFIGATDERKDEGLQSALRNAKAPVVMGAADRRADLTPSEREFQQKFLSAVGRPVGFINVRHDDDDVVRYTSPSDDSQYPQSFAALLAEQAKIKNAIKSAADASRASTRVAWLLGPKIAVNPFCTIWTDDLLAGEQGKAAASASTCRPEDLRGKVVIVGADIAYRDRHRTPMSVWSEGDVPGALIHAQVLAQLLDGRRYRELGPVVACVYLLALLGVGFALSWRFWRTRSDFLGLGVATAVLIVVDALLYHQARLILPFTLSLYVWLIGVTAGHHGHTIADWLRNRREV